MLKVFGSSVIALLVIAGSVEAATFVVPDDGEMVRRAQLIVIGTVADSYSEVTADRRLHTVNDIVVERVLKGSASPGETIRDTELGGEYDGRVLAVSGVPHYEPGDRVLVMLWKNVHGEWTTTEFVLGKFLFAKNVNGRELLVRESQEICGWDTSWQPYVERTRSAAEFIAFIGARSSGRVTPANYFVSDYEACLDSTATARRVTPDSMSLAYLPSDYIGFTYNYPVRWPNNATASFKTSGTQPNIADSVGSAQIALAVWTNDANSNINYSYGGTSTVTCSGMMNVCNNPDSENTIIFNDPSNEITGTFSGSGTLAVGGPWFSGATHTFATQTFNNIVNGDLVVQNGVGSYLSSAQFQSVLAHELGHTLGFRHSNEGTPLASNALMTSSLNNGPQSATLLQWDMDAAATVYGAGGGCTPVSITGNPSSTTVAYNSGTTLTVGTSGSDPKTYQWYRGSTGDTSNPIAGATSSSYSTGSLTTTTSYWVRVTNCSGANVASSNTATVTVDCKPSITGYTPSSRTVNINQGGNANLGVNAAGQATITYQWYRSSTVGDTSGGVLGTDATFNTGALTQTAYFWVRLSNGCGTTNSGLFTVNVCVPVSINGQPQNQQITSGQSAYLSVTAAGTGPFSYQWYRGTSGNTTTPISLANSASYNTGTLTTTASYWVRVSNACGHIDSNTATITVAGSCTAPSITTQPQSVAIQSGHTAALSVVATGTALTYQWFQVVGVNSNPVGTNSSSFTTPALTTSTSYFVRITNSCGTATSATVTVSISARLRKHPVRRPGSSVPTAGGADQFPQ